MSRISAKSLGDAGRDLVYTPLTPCRLIDTRGYGAPIQGGAFAPNERRSYVPNGSCSLPTAGVATILVSFTTENLTPTSGGYLAILAPGAVVTTTVDVFNLGAEWSASNTAVATGSASQFDVFVNTARAHVVIDVLGYFAAPRGDSLVSFNTFTGAGSGNSTMTGTSNTGSGVFALVSNTTGNFNTADGGSALQSNTTGSENTATGDFALFSNTTGSFNTASGTSALQSNTTASQNSAFGDFALHFNTTGSSNSAIGSNALRANTTGDRNTAGGSSALAFNTTGTSNTATGVAALESNTTGANNTASGDSALFANTIGVNNTALGVLAGANLTTGSSNIDIGNQGIAGESSTIRIGDNLQTRTFIAGIRGVATGVANGVAVVIDSNGQLGTISSSRRFKDDVSDMDAASSALMSLRPVTFLYKADRSASGRTLQYGLIAEEVAQVYPGLIAHSADGAIETVMYQFLPPMLLNEYQKQQREIEAQRRVIAQLQAKVADIDALKNAMSEMGRLIDRLRRDDPLRAAAADR